MSNHLFFFFFFNDTATTEIYTLSLHDALPILRASTTSIRSCSTSKSRFRRSLRRRPRQRRARQLRPSRRPTFKRSPGRSGRSEEHTSELQSRQYLVCRLLLEKKKQRINISIVQ